MSYKHLFEISNTYDSCKKCGCTFFECKHCSLQEYYRHVDDKAKFKLNCKRIRNLGLLGNISKFK